MDCDRVQRLLNAYVDGELDLVNSLDVEEHLGASGRAGCPACTREYQSLTALRSAFREHAGDPALYHPAPAGLEERVRASLAQETRREGETSNRDSSIRQFVNTLFGNSSIRDSASGSRITNHELPYHESTNQRITPTPRLSFPALALAAVLLFALGFLVSRLPFSASPDAQLAQQVETAHLRSLMADHLTDVASTNQHTVKPWFNGRLDFSPPVVDLAAQGYPLVGGRLDYMDNRPVAALVYHRSQHIINLFIWPSAGAAGGAPATSEYNGYHVIHWTQGGMTYWAVSDVNVAELQAFVRLVQSNFKE